jgi:hypothetical protein
MREIEWHVFTLKFDTPFVPKGMQFPLLEESRDFNFDQNYTENTNIYNPKQISID